MMKRIDRLTDRVLSLLGLGFDLEFQMYGDFFNQLREDFFLGARPTREHIDMLREAGITHVVSCLDAAERPKMAFLGADFETLFLAIHDGIHEDIATVLPTFVAFADSMRERDSAAKLFVHCQVGVSRSATLAIALLMEREQKGFLETFLDVRSKRVQILPNIGFASQLQRLEHEHNPQMAADGEISSLARYLHQICNVPAEIGLLQSMLERHDYDAFSAIRAIFGDDFPRVIQGVRL